MRRPKLFSSFARRAIICEFVFLVVLPNVLVRAITPGVVRPLFFCFLLTSVGGLIILGFVGEIYILRHDPEYGAKSENWTRYWLILPFAIVLSGYLLIHACSVGTDYLKFAVGHAKLREVTATITDRKGPPGMFIFADQLTLSGGQDLSLPYSDLPAVGGTYRFTMLPTENVALSYETVRPSHWSGDYEQHKRVTDASGNVVEALDYSPFGGLRIDTKSNYGGLRNKYAVAKSRQVEHMGDSGQLLLLLQIFRSAGVRVVYSERALTKTFSWNGPLRDRRIRKGEAVLDVGSLGHVLENPK